MASVRERAGKRGKTFMALYRDGEGRQRSAGSYKTRKEALKMARLAEAGMPVVKTEPVYAARVRGKITVASYAREWLPGHPLAPHSRYVYDQIMRTHIIPALGGRALADVTSADIRAMFRRMEHDGASRPLLAKVKTVMSSMFQTASEDRLMQYNPVRGVRFQAAPSKRRRALTADEWLRVRKYLPGQHRLLAEVQMATGARIEEIMAMETGDIKSCTWHVQRVRNELRSGFATKDTTKTGKGRMIPVEPVLARRIKAMPAGRVFTDIPGSTRRKVWRQACKAAGLDWYPAPRDLRRTFATLAREGGADLEAVRIALGHAHISTTDIYLGERPGTSSQALQAVQRALGAA